MNLRLFAAAVLTLLGLLAVPICAASSHTSFTCQGRLSDSGVPATGHFDLRFQLFDAETRGTALASPITRNDVGVKGGVNLTGD